jgi:AcrR family transcriptional regulator
MEKNIRENLIENAQRLIAEKGYHKTRVEDITKASGVAKGTFYNYFSSKEELISTFLKERLEKYINILNEIVAEETTLREKLKKMIGIELAMMSQSPAFFMTIMELKRLRVSEKPLFTVREQLKDVKEAKIYGITEKLFQKHIEEIREEYRSKICHLLNLLASFTFGFLTVRIDRYLETRDAEKEFKIEELENFLKKTDIKEEAELLSSIYIRGILKGEE